MLEALHILSPPRPPNPATTTLDLIQLAEAEHAACMPHSLLPDACTHTHDSHACVRAVLRRVDEAISQDSAKTVMTVVGTAELQADPPIRACEVQQHSCGTAAHGGAHRADESTSRPAACGSGSAIGRRPGPGPGPAKTNLGRTPPSPMADATEPAHERAAAAEQAAAGTPSERAVTAEELVQQLQALVDEADELQACDNLATHRTARPIAYTPRPSAPNNTSETIRQSMDYGGDAAPQSMDYAGDAAAQSMLDDAGEIYERPHELQVAVVAGNGFGQGQSSPKCVNKQQTGVGARPWPM